MCPDEPDGGDGTDGDSPVSRFTGEYPHDFEIWTECYDSSREVEMLRDRLSLTNARLLDAGCGAGRLAFRLASDCGEIVGVDVQRPLIDLCRSRMSSEDRGRVSFEVADAADLPFEDDAFDVALDAWLLSSLDDPAPVAEEYSRVVADGGQIAVIVERSGSEYEEVLRQAGPRFGYDTGGIESFLTDHFGSPLAADDIVAPYIYRSLDEAYDAFDFHFEEWLNVSLGDERREAVREQIREHRWDSHVRLHEYARVYVFQNNRVEPRDDA